MRKFTIAFAALILVACGEADQPRQAENDSQEFSAEKVEKMYNSMCAICHGKDGKMAYAGAKDLTATELTLDERVAIIKYGKGQMTPFEGRLTQEQMVALAKYIDKLKE